MTPSGNEPATFRLVAQGPQAYGEHFITNKLTTISFILVHRIILLHVSTISYSHLQAAWIYKRKSSKANGKICC